MKKSMIQKRHPKGSKGTSNSDCSSFCIKISANPPWSSGNLKIMCDYISGWWFGTFFILHNILGMSSSQLTFIFFRGVGIPSIRYTHIMFDSRFLDREEDKSPATPPRRVGFASCGGADEEKSPLGKPSWSGETPLFDPTKSVDFRWFFHHLC